MVSDTGHLARICKEHHAYVSTDNDFQRRARLLQTTWRESRGLPIGEHRGRPLGSRLAMPFAEESLANYLTENVRDVVRAEVLDRTRSRGKLFGRPRIFDDLLSSQPLCFNLFGELRSDLELASRVFARLTEGRVRRVSSIAFEHSPGRSDARFTGDRSAFDVFLELETGEGTRGFVGIEVKYHEGLGDKPAPHRPRYDEIAHASGAFRVDELARLQEKPLQQIWRDHLLALSLLASPASGYQEGIFVFLYPERNERCRAAVARYGEHLSNARSFQPLTLERLVETIQSEGDPRWVAEFVERYLKFDRVAELIAAFAELR